MKATVLAESSGCSVFIFLPIEALLWSLGLRQVDGAPISSYLFMYLI